MTSVQFPSNIRSVGFKSNIVDSRVRDQTTDEADDTENPQENTVRVNHLAVPDYSIFGLCFDH